MYFARPWRVIVATELTDVQPALQDVEHLVNEKGWHAAGFLSYEAASAFDPALQTHAARSADLPYLWFGLYPEPEDIVLPPSIATRKTPDWTPTTSREEYDSSISKIKRYIADGRTYQVNYTLRLESKFSDSPWEFFLCLAHRQNEHAAYVDTGRYVICSASPELFFELDGNTMTCRPMKGTAPRGRTTAEDRRQAKWLRNSEKNRAENVMIVDMIRNDLGRVAQTGSVQVTSLFEAERYPTLWQMTSTITARTNETLTGIFTALFPCASITGAPKVSTMKIIAELESTPRKIYTGSIGFLAPQRKAKFNVAIRTALIDRERQHAEYGVGGGIVWDSTSAEEYTEALLKARTLVEDTRPFSLLETMLWTPQDGFFLMQKHIDRMVDSAAYFGVPITREALEKYFGKISSRFETPQRVRVLLDPEGKLEVESAPFAPAEQARPLQVRLARRPIDSRNVFLFHKTTRRDVYEEARRGLDDVDDVLLYNEKEELTEFTIGNFVAELEGQLCTPPISCAVLPGTFRAHLLETGQIAERPIHIKELVNCTRMFRINSIRRWQEVQLQLQKDVNFA